jgi:hypothetical protein
VTIPVKISDAKIDMSNGGWGPIQYEIDRIPSFDIWASALGFNCFGFIHKYGKDYS